MTSRDHGLLVLAVDDVSNDGLPISFHFSRFVRDAPVWKIIQQKIGRRIVSRRKAQSGLLPGRYSLHAPERTSLVPQGIRVMSGRSWREAETTLFAPLQVPLGHALDSTLERPHERQERQ